MFAYAILHKSMFTVVFTVNETTVGQLHHAVVPAVNVKAL